jgi:excisionase family DNA binding protein
MPLPLDHPFEPAALDVLHALVLNTATSIWARDAAARRGQLTMAGRIIRIEDIEVMIATEEVARILNINPRTVRDWCDKGYLQHYKVGKAGTVIRFKPSELAADIEAIKVQRRAG